MPADSFIPATIFDWTGPAEVPTPAPGWFRAKLWPGEPACRHCRRGRINRPRGLCWTCYYTPGVRELYPSTSKFANRGIGSEHVLPRLPDVPTTAAPGTPEKVAVLEQRARMKLAIFHPADARYEGDPRPFHFLRTGEILIDPPQRDGSCGRARHILHEGRARRVKGSALYITEAG